MPAKIQLDENLWFLYVCHQSSDYKQIDFNAVGEKSGLKAPAARMRYTRLKSKIENGTLIGTHGTPYIAAPKDKTTKVPKKRKSSGEESGGKLAGSIHDDVEKLEELGPVMSMRTRGKRVRVKLGDEDGEVGYMSSGGSSEYGDAGDGDLDTEDDLDDHLPMAKNKVRLLSKKRLKGVPVTATKVASDLVAAVDGPQHSTSLSNAPFSSNIGPVSHAASLKIDESLGVDGDTDQHSSVVGIGPGPGISPADIAIAQIGDGSALPPVASLQNCSISSPRHEAFPGLEDSSKAEHGREGI